MTSDAPAGGRHRIDPGSELTVRLSAHVETPAIAVRLVAELPYGWTVLDPDGGVVDSTARTITWLVGDVADQMRAVFAPRLRAPLRSTAGEPAFTGTFAARLEHVDGIVATDSASVLVAPELIVAHSVFAQVAPVSQDPAYLATDRALTDVLRFDAFRIRFQVRNADLPEARFAPNLQYRVGGFGIFADVPVGDAVAGLPFYIGAEWRRTGVGTGTVPGQPQESISAGEMIVRDTDDPTQAPATGRRVMGRAGTAGIAVPGDSYTEVEFSVRASIDLPPGAWFELRLTDRGHAIPGATIASVVAESTPRVELTAGQQGGVPVGPPADAQPSNPRGIASLDFPLVTPGVIAATWGNPGGLPVYRLAVAVPGAPDAQPQLGAPDLSPHETSPSLDSDTCAQCHSAHTASSSPLLSASGSTPPGSTSYLLPSLTGVGSMALSATASSSPSDAICLTCHDGNGASSKVQSPTAAAISAVDQSSSEYFSHDAASDATLQCATCHNPHIATGAPAIQTATGWTIAGAQLSVSGSVALNGNAGTTPTYTIQDGSAGHQPTREYELCLKCHTGEAVASNAGQPPSRYQLDKGIELNPANYSYHPVEGAGRNTTAAMALSLAGTSPYKMWNFTTDGTVRCVNCHADSSKYSSTTAPAAGSDLAPHSSQYRGILIQNYRDRVLKSSGEAYAAADSALCLVCHAEEGFVSNASGAPTNFRLHQEHLTGLAGKGNGGTDIDTPGAGQGNAICAECHFRIHGTALAYQVGDRSNTRLVNFAPNVLPEGATGTLKWTATGVGTGTCTLTCHGYDHVAKSYGP
jgi:Doubled CXXCH motif (Paired_CXXCH_1)